VFKGQLSLGQLVAAELIVTSVTTSIAKIGKDLESYYDLVAGLHKVGKLIDLPLEPSAGELPPEPDKEGGVTIHLENLKARHGTGHFKDVNLLISAGERIGVTGPDGAALSTLLDILYGVRIPCEGYIHFDGANLQDLSVSALRDHVMLVREADIFEGTIEQNLRLGQRDIPSNQLRRALSDVGLLSEFEHLKDGIRTPLGANGSPLSMGQLQRLTFARAILFEPRLILLDHVLDSLHYEQIGTALKALRQYNSTTVIVSNRHSVLSQCDRVFELMRDGQLIEKHDLESGRDGEA
jgi:putative ABC transport system ATP-binding protein